MSPVADHPDADDRADTDDRDEADAADSAEPHRDRPADSAGQPWAGRSFQRNEHSTDDGSADPALIAAIHDFHAGEAAEDAVVDAFRRARLLIPLLAEAGETERSANGLVHDKTQELAIVTVEGPDGRPVLPAFSSVDTLRRWDPHARPVPAVGDRVALAAVGEHTDLVILDPDAETAFAVRRPALWSVAQSQPWVPSHRDPDVLLAFLHTISSELGVLDLNLLSGDPRSTLVGPELVVRLQLAAGLTDDELNAVLGRLAQRWAADDVIATRVDSLRVQLLAA